MLQIKVFYIYFPDYFQTDGPEVFQFLIDEGLELGFKEFYVALHVELVLKILYVILAGKNDVLELIDLFRISLCLQLKVSAVSVEGFFILFNELVLLDELSENDLLFLIQTLVSYMDQLVFNGQLQLVEGAFKDYVTLLFTMCYHKELLQVDALFLLYQIALELFYVLR